MAITPNKVILAIAYAISDFLAFITGAVATIAVAPQTLVPIAIKYDIFDEIGTFLIKSLISVSTAKIQTIIRGIAIDPNFINSSKLNLIPKQIIPSFKIYCCVKSRPVIIPGLGVKAFPINIPSSIAINTVEIGLFSVPKISIAKRLFIPWENKQNTKAKTTPGKIDFMYWNLTNTYKITYALL